LLLKNIQQKDFVRKQIRSNSIKQLLYIVSSVSIFFNLQIHSILQSENKLKKAENTDKIITNRKEVKKAKKIEIETRKTKIKIKTTEISTEADAKTNAKAAAAAATATTNRKCLLKLCKQFVYIYISFVYKTVLILLSCLLLFNNL